MKHSAFKYKRSKTGEFRLVWYFEVHLKTLNLTLFFLFVVYSCHIIRVIRVTSKICCKITRIARIRKHEFTRKYEHLLCIKEL